MKGDVGPSTFTGLIRNAEGGPAAKVAVRIFDGERQIGTAKTDRHGAFAVELKAPTPETLTVQVDEPQGHPTRIRLPLGTATDTHLDVRTKPGHSGEVRIAGELVNLQAAAKLSNRQLVLAYLALRRGVKPRARAITAAFPDLQQRRQARDGEEECGEGRGEIIRRLLEERRADKELDELSDLDDFPAGTTVHWFYTERIRVKYTLAGTHAVSGATPAADTELRLSDGTSVGWLRANLVDLHPDNTELAPTYVQKVGAIAEWALTRLINPPFSMRDPRSGAARMEYRLLAQAAGIAGQTSASWSHVEVDIDNADQQNFGTVPHELFHQVQYRYNPTTTRSGIYGILREGGARLIEDSLDDQPNRYVSSGALFFSTPQVSLLDIPVGTSTALKYAGGLLWKFIAEHHSFGVSAASEPAIGVDAYRAVLEETGTAAGDPGLGYTTDALRNARARQPWYGRFDRFGWYDAALTELGSHETSWGNFLLANYLHAMASPSADGRFDYLEDDQPDLSGSRLRDLTIAFAAADDFSLAQGTDVTRAVVGHLPFAARFYRVRPSAGAAPRMLRITLTATAGMTDPLVQVIRLGSGTGVVDIHRSDRASYTKVIPCNGIAEIGVIVASRENGGDFQVRFQEVAAASDVMVTRWNTSVGREYEVDPAGWTWTWVSPDVMVDTNDDGLSDAQVYFDRDNKLKIRLRNRGNADASNITVDLWYQKATPYLTSSGWIPVTNQTGIVQQIGPVNLAAGAEAWFSAFWAPVDDGTHHPHWCIKAAVTAPADESSDNKVVLSNFASVVVPPDGDLMIPLLVRLPEHMRSYRLLSIARGPLETLRLRDLPAPPATADEVRRACAADVMAAPARAVFAQATTNGAAGQSKAMTDDARRLPRQDIYYPIDPTTLPPGVDPATLVTVTQLVDGELIGGVTYQILRRSKRRTAPTTRGKVAATK